MTEKEWLKKLETLKTDEVIEKKDKCITAVEEKLLNAIKKNLPNEKFGILFSGGIDSTLLAMIAKKENKNFICYTVGMKNATDVQGAEEAAMILGFKHKVRILNDEEAEKIIHKMIKTLNEPDVMKVGVGAVVYAGLEIAKMDGITKVLGGLGSEEIFAGYERHLESDDINKECWKGLETMWQRDISRDKKIADLFGIKLITPFLDADLIKTAMKVPGKYKIDMNHKKLILREIAYGLGMPKEFAFRKKTAAQYGSNFDKAIMRIAKKKGFHLKKDYLNSFF